MQTAIYHVPAFDLIEARETAHAVHAGRLVHAEHYRCPDAADRVCAHLNRLSRDDRRRQVFPVAIEIRTHDDGRVPVAWTIDKLGDAAAAFLIVCILPALSAQFWGLLG